jgi:hypothetical protein
VPPLASAVPDNTVVVLDADGRASDRAGFSTCYALELPGGVMAAASRGRVRWVDTSADDSPDHGSGRSGPVVPGPVLTVASVVRRGVEVRLARLDDVGEPVRSLRLSGWPVSGETPPETGAACARTADLRSEVRPLRGFTTADVAVESGTSPLGEWTAIPFVATEGPPEPGAVYAAVVVLDRGGPDEPGPSLAITADGVTLAWPDGVTAHVALPK